MMYRCLECNYEEARGCLPTATCGLYAIGLMGPAGAILALAADYVRSLVRSSSDATTGPGEDSGLGWWALLVFPVAILLWFVVLFIVVLILNAILELIEWLVFFRRRCPLCGRKRWSWGFTRGFGL